MTKEEARQQFERAKEDYWRMRDELLRQHPDKWVAVKDGQVIAVADHLHLLARILGERLIFGPMYVNWVGNEDKLKFRIRHFSWNYYPPAPVVDVELSTPSVAVMAEAVIDTGADMTVMPVPLAVQLGADQLPSVQASVGGVTGGMQETEAYTIAVTVAGRTFMPLVAALGGLDEVLLGRDVLNNFILTVNGKDMTVSLQDP